MGRAIGRIEKEIIFNAILENKVPLTIHGYKKEFQAHLINWEGKYLEIATDYPLKNEIQDDEEVRVFFSYYGHTMTFTSKVIQLANDDDNIEIQKPAGIYRDLQRKYQRVHPPSEVELQFTFESTQIILDFPRTKESYPIEEPPENSEYDLSNIQNLINQFKSKAHEFSQVHTITMFREHKPESFEENIIVNTGKPLFIPNTADGFPSKEQFHEEMIIVGEDFPDPTHTNELLLGKHRQNLNSYLSLKEQQEIKSEIYYPIMYQEYVAGYICLANYTDSGRVLTLEQLEFTAEFAKILVYTLAKNGYFSVQKRETGDYKPQIIDISASGLLFTHDSEELVQNLGMYTDIELQVQVGHRKIKTDSRVMRKYNDGNTHFYGLQFMEIKPEDFRFLFDYVYGRPFSEKDQDYWEGGAKPPELEF